MTIPLDVDKILGNLAVSCGYDAATADDLFRDKVTWLLGDYDDLLDLPVTPELLLTAWYRLELRTFWTARLLCPLTAAEDVSWAAKQLELISRKYWAENPAAFMRARSRRDFMQDLNLEGTAAEMHRANRLTLRELLRHQAIVILRPPLP